MAHYKKKKVKKSCEVAHLIDFSVKSGKNSTRIFGPKLGEIFKKT